MIEKLDTHGLKHFPTAATNKINEIINYLNWQSGEAKRPCGCNKDNFCKECNPPNAEKALPFEACKECIEVSKAIGIKVREKAENPALYKTCEATQDGTLNKAIGKAEEYCKYCGGKHKYPGSCLTPINREKAERCPTCDGKGWYSVENREHQEEQRECEHCNGAGKPSVGGVSEEELIDIINNWGLKDLTEGIISSPLQVKKLAHAIKEIYEKNL